MTRPSGGAGAERAARGVAWSFVVAAMLGATACAGDEPFVTYIGVVDATPPRLGRPIAAVLPSDAGADAGADGSAGPALDGGAPGDVAQDTSSGEEIADAGAAADSEAAPE
jgi:hypothetical protein